MPFSVSRAPGDDGLWLNWYQRVAPRGEYAPYENPEDAIAVLDLRTFHAALLDNDLLAQSGVLKGEASAVCNEGLDQSEKVGEPGHLAILTVDSVCAKVLLVIPLSCGFGAADEDFGRHCRPNKDTYRPLDLDSQWSAEAFYRIQVSPNFALTPDIQLLIDPALNPTDEFIAVFGLRGRLAF